MNKVYRNIVVFAVILFMFVACRYEDGPWISFRSEASRLNNEWQVQVFKIFLDDTTIAWKTHYDWKFTFYLPEGNAKDEGLMYLYAPKPFCAGMDSNGYHGEGYWKFENGANNLTMKYWFKDRLDTTQTIGDSCGIWPLVTQEEITFQIRRLKHDQLWLRYTISGDTIISIKFEES